MNYDAMDECQYCVRAFWKPWLYELLDIEGIAKQEEREATFNARDATTKSERDLSLKRREVAAEAILTIRSAKIAVMNALDAIEAEKAKRYAIDKEKYGISVERNLADTNYKEKIAIAVKAKKIQEIRYEVMLDWSNKWKLRQAEIAQYETEADYRYATKGQEHERLVKPKPDSKDDAAEKEKEEFKGESETSIQSKQEPQKSRQRGGLARQLKAGLSKEKLGSPKKGSPSLSKEKLNASRDGSPKGSSYKEKGLNKKESPVQSTEPGATSNKEKAEKKETLVAGGSKDKTDTEKKAMVAKDSAEKKEPPATNNSDKKTTEKDKDNKDKK